MLSIERRRISQLSIAAWLLAIAAPPCRADPPLESPRDGRAAEQQLVAEIASTTSADGPYAHELVDPLSALAEIYESSGDHGLALAAIGQALQIVRANKGLFSLDQAPLLWATMHDQEADGDATAAWETDHHLLALAERNPDDVRSADVFRRIGDRRMDLLTRYVAGEHPPEIVLGCYYSRGGVEGERMGAALGFWTSCKAGSRSVVIESIAHDAWTNYLAAIGVMVRHGMYSSRELRELENGLIQSGFEHRAYGLGHESYRRLAAYDTANHASAFDKAVTAVETADWDLLFGHYTLAAKEYEDAYASVAAANVSPQLVESLFSPAVPVALPVFEPNPLSSQPQSDDDAHLDVSFEVDQLGFAIRVRIDDSANASRDDEKRLRQIISRTQFRPQLRDGQIERKAGVALRYFIDADEPLRIARAASP